MNGPKELCTANGFQQPTASSEAIQETPDDDNVPGDEKKHENDNVSILYSRGGGTGESGEATASPEFRGFTTEKFLASWMYERGNFSCFTGKNNYGIIFELLLL